MRGDGGARFLGQAAVLPWWGLCDRSGCELGSESCIIGWSGCFWDTGWRGIRPRSHLPSLLPVSGPSGELMAVGTPCQECLKTGCGCRRRKTGFIAWVWLYAFLVYYDVIMPFAYISMCLTAWACST